MGVSDHGALTGLADDDHGQYLTTGRADTWLATKSTNNLLEGGSNLYFTDERAQDAVGAALTDTASIDFTYNDVGNTISAVVLPAGVAHGSLAGLTTGDPHTQYVVLSPTADARNVIKPSADTVKGLVLQWFSATQSDNILEFQNQAGTQYAAMTNTQLLAPTGTHPGTPGLSFNGVTGTGFAATTAQFSIVVATTIAMNFIQSTSEISMPASWQLGFSASTPASQPDTKLGRSGAGVFRTGASSTYHALILGAPTASTVGLTVIGAASQSANLQEWQNSAGTVLASVTPTMLLGPIGGLNNPGIAFIGNTTAGLSANVNGLLINAAGATAIHINSAAVRIASTHYIAWSSGNPTTSPDTFLVRVTSNVIRTGDPSTSVYGALLVGSPAVATVGLTVRGITAQSANLQEWLSSAAAVLATVSENGYFTTRKNAAPADAELIAGEAAYWFDSTNGAAKFKVKAKQADGTVVSGEVALA